jgi:hypothetical protein
MALFCFYFVGGSALAQNKSIDISAGNGKSNTKYAYFYKGELVNLNLSKRLIAVEENYASLDVFVANNNLSRDPSSEHAASKKNGLGLYRLPIPKDKTTNHLDLNAQFRSWAQTYNQIIQPVFEQGSELLIPSDEVLVGFKIDVTFKGAQTYLVPHMISQGIIELSLYRKNTYILKINNPSDGRVYQVSQYLSTLDEICFEFLQV